MGMREEVQAELAEAFDDPDGLADAVRLFTGEREGEGQYDPVTGVVSPSLITYGGRGVFGSYESKEIDGSLILATDEKLLILQNEVFITEDDEATAVAAVPAVGDIIAGKRVMNVSRDPADATFTVQLRA